jgi:hypothetical protein
MTAPMPAARTDDQLVEVVSAYETQDEIPRAGFEDYLHAETELEGRLLGRAIQLGAACEHEQAVELLDLVISLNETMRRVAKRERDRVGRDTDDGEFFGWCRQAASGLILLAEGQKLLVRAEQCRILGDLDSGLDLVREAFGVFEELAGSDYPQAGIGRLRCQVTMATGTLYEAISCLRVGNYRGAHDALDIVRVTFEELLADAAETEPGGDGPVRAMLTEVSRDLSSSLVDIGALQGVVDMMMAGQAGRFRDMVDIGAEALAAYETAVQAASASSVGRHMIALRRMEMDTVSFWIDFARAEIAVNEHEWTTAYEAVRSARRHLTDLSRMGVRNQEVGLTATRPDVSTLEFLLAAVLRRADREKYLLEQRDDARSSLRTAQLSRVNVINHNTNSAEARGGKSTVGDKFEFHAPVQNNGNLGGQHNRATVTAAQQQVATGDAQLRRLADELAALRQVLEIGPRTAEERQSVEHLRDAESAARTGDEEGARGHLARVGRWVLGAAERIGVEVATAALRQSIGA